jgi:hypothetical protein
MRHFRYRDAKKVQKQLESLSKASQKRSRGRLLRQKDFKECPTIGSGPINGVDQSMEWTNQWSGLDPADVKKWAYH